MSYTDRVWQERTINTMNELTKAIRDLSIGIHNLTVVLNDRNIKTDSYWQDQDEKFKELTKDFR